MPEVVVGHARRPDVELADVQFQLLAEDVVGVTHVARVIDELGGEDGILLDDVLPAEGLVVAEFRICPGDALDGVSVRLNLVRRQGVLEENDAIALKGRPLLRREAARGELVLGGLLLDCRGHNDSPSDR